MTTCYTLNGIARELPPVGKFWLAPNATLIPTALKNDRCPCSGCDGRDAVLVVGEECPGVACLVEDVVVTVEYGNRELVAAQIFPDVFDWVEFGRVGRQGDEGDVVGNGEILGDVIARTVEDQSGVAAWSDLTPDLGQMQ